MAFRTEPSVLHTIQNKEPHVRIVSKRQVRATWVVFPEEKDRLTLKVTGDCLDQKTESRLEVSFSLVLPIESPQIRLYWGVQALVEAPLFIHLLTVLDSNT